MQYIFREPQSAIHEQASLRLPDLPCAGRLRGLVGKFSSPRPARIEKLDAGAVAPEAAAAAPAPADPGRGCRRPHRARRRRGRGSGFREIARRGGAGDLPRRLRARRQRAVDRRPAGAVPASGRAAGDGGRAPDAGRPAHGARQCPARCWPRERAPAQPRSNRRRRRNSPSWPPCSPTTERGSGVQQPRRVRGIISEHAGAARPLERRQRLQHQRVAIARAGSRGSASIIAYSPDT